MKVKLLRKDKNAVVPFKTHNEDFCYDVVAVSEEEVAPNVWKYGLGWAMEIERDESIHNVGRMILHNVLTGENSNYIYSQYVAMGSNAAKLSIDLRPRSSVWKTGMILSNCEGTIDELYRGEVSAVFYHIMTDMPRYRVGDKIGQIKIGVTFPIEFEAVDELSETERGEGGFGSTDGKQEG